MNRRDLQQSCHAVLLSTWLVLGTALLAAPAGVKLASGKTASAVPTAKRATEQTAAGRVWLYVKAGAQEDPRRPFVQSGGTLHSGDVIEIELEGERPGYAYVAQKQESGQAKLLDDQAMRIEPERILSKRFRLDDAIGKEQLLFVFSSAVLTPPELQRHLVAAAAQEDKKQDKDQSASRVPPAKRPPPRPVDEKDRSQDANRSRYALSVLPNAAGVAVLRFAFEHASSPPSGK